eukprot:5089321-Prymnesium_polylepis.1
MISCRTAEMSDVRSESPTTTDTSGIHIALAEVCGRRERSYSAVVGCKALVARSPYTLSVMGFSDSGFTSSITNRQRALSIVAPAGMSTFGNTTATSCSISARRDWL